MPFILETKNAELTLTKLRAEARKGRSLQECCQALMEHFQAAFADSIILARTYATIPYELLPAPDRDFVKATVDRQGAGDLLEEKTPVLSLMGTAGVLPQWRRRYDSRGHLAIPLLSEDFVAEIPMLASLIQQLGSSSSWFQKHTGPDTQTNSFGVFTDTFFVADAAQSTDSAGRLMIPAQDFVQEHNIHTVFGVGGEFVTEGVIVVSIFFSNERLTATPKWLLRLPLLLATATRSLVAQGKLYATDPSPLPELDKAEPETSAR
jgi:hypothetical protein